MILDFQYFCIKRLHIFYITVPNNKMTDFKRKSYWMISYDFTKITDFFATLASDIRRQ